MLLILTAVLILFLIWWGIGHYNTYKPTVKHVDIKITHPLENNGLRILHLSDLHMERCSISPENLLKQVKSERIDLIALTGDYLDTKQMTDRFLQYMDALHSLNPRYGMYAVFGNHDYCIADHLPYIQTEMERRGCIVLKNEHHTIEIDGHKLNIIGIDDAYTGRSDADQAYRGISEGINLVLTHDPHIVLDMNHHFDYLLSGHFHGGQICWPKPYHLRKMGKLPGLNIISGLHYHRQRAFYISDGLGQTGFNLRYGSRPEITFHSLGSGTSIKS